VQKKLGTLAAGVKSCRCCGLVQSNVCKHVTESGRGHLFASAQCLGYSFEFGELTDELCFPSRNVVLNQVKRAVERLGAVAVYVAADRDAMISDLETTLKGKVRCHSPLQYQHRHHQHADI